MRAQTRYMPQWFHYFGGLADKIEGRVIPIDKPGFFNFTREEPLGVIAAIMPWNSPLLLAGWKLAPALAAGNTVRVEAVRVLLGLRARDGRSVREAGFPPGVVNIVTGFGDEIGDALVDAPGRREGRVHRRRRNGRSSSTQAAAKHIKPVTMELGGKSREHRVRRRRTSTTRSRASSPASSRPPARPASRARAR